MIVLYSIVALSMLCTACGYSVSYSCIGKLGAARGISKGTIAALISAGGVVETFGRLLNGYLANKKYTTAIVQYTICVFMYGLTSCIGASIQGTPGG